MNIRIQRPVLRVVSLATALATALAVQVVGGCAIQTNKPSQESAKNVPLKRASRTNPSERNVPVKKTLREPPSSDAGSSENRSVETFRCSKAIRVIESRLEDELGIAVTLDVHKNNYISPWRYITGRPEMPDGLSVDYTSTPLAESVSQGVFDDVVLALIEETNTARSCTMAEYSFAATDSPVPDWLEEHSLPTQLLQ